ncbi:MAG: adenylate/guanylate cyclase domain-containing protein [Arenicella sp.]|nr:adenylate/guanylate cyclase domain-containing protein [Arenicella sp.]
MFKKYLARVLIGLGITGLFLAYNQGQLKLPLVDRLELLAYDARLALTLPEKQVDPRVVIIDLDERSLIEEGHWPWNRVKLAKLVHNLFDVYQLDILGFDVVFAERDSSEELDLLETLAIQSEDQPFLQRYLDYKPHLNPDTVFANAMQDRQVVLGYYFDKSLLRQTFTGSIGEPIVEQGSEFYDMLRLQKNQKLRDDGTAYVDELEVTSFTGNVPELEQSALASGFYDIPSQDKDGVLRRIQLLEKYDGELYESLSLSLARHYLVGELEFKTAVDQDGKQIIDGLDIGTGVVPLDDQGTTYIPYRGKAFSFRYVSATDILNQTVENPEDLEYAIGIVGTTAAGLIDLRNMPLQNNYPGVEVHAATIAGLLDADFRSRPYYSTAAEFVVILLVGLLLSCLLPIVGATGEILAWIGASALLIGGNLYFWESQNTILSIAPVLLLVMLLYMFNVAWGYFFETRTKAKLSGLFGQYIPPELVEEMARDPEAYNLEAKKQQLTVLFSDVRGFTNISEGLDPKALSNLMNELLSPMTRIVHDNKGTIDKYMGDAMMAFWGAPVDDPDHASRAVQSGLLMLKELSAINETFRAKNWPEVKIGIGLNTGEMNVGNMGSEFRMAYTVLGDAVNLGSRVEGLTKAYGVDFIATEFTAAATPEYEYRKLDRVKVKGKDEPVAILEPMDLTENLSAGQLQERDQYHEALELYLAQKFAEAIRLLRQLNEQYGERFVHNLYIERCEHFLKEPPGTDWDGVFTFTTK